MEQFSLEKYLANPTKRVVTRNGKNARIICTDRAGAQPIVALCSCPTYFRSRKIEYEDIVTANKDGKCITLDDSPLDLFFNEEGTAESTCVAPSICSSVAQELITDNVCKWFSAYLSTMGQANEWCFGDKFYDNGEKRFRDFMQSQFKLLFNK